MPVIGSPNAHARNHRVPRSFRATPRKIAHLMIRCRTGDPLLFRMTRNSRLMLSICPPLSVGSYRGQGAGFASIQPAFILSLQCVGIEVSAFSLCPYSPKCVELEFSEVCLLLQFLGSLNRTSGGGIL